MFWEKKTRPGAQPGSINPEEASPAASEVETLMSVPTVKVPFHASVAGSQHTVLGRTVVLQGQLSAHEDLAIEGQFEGTVSAEGHCVTVGPEGQVKAEIRARQIVILGSVTGNLVAREKIEIRRNGHVVGDLLAATVAIEDGAYFKGNIDVASEEGAGAASDGTAPRALKIKV
jgi:cytoskeletal protein CcmA (bactofilin family)